jgi:alpha-L-fucosidase
MSDVPSYLRGYEAQYAQDPKAAALAWFRDARYGLFLHYGLYSLLRRGEWVQYQERIPVAEYARLQDRFTAERFDAPAICALARDAGMRYLTITTRHHDSFCLFRTAQTAFNSLTAPCGRDLIAELAAACRDAGLGVFLYYSYACDWRHPYFYPREAGCTFARPVYDTPQPEYHWRTDADMGHYIAFVHAQLEELLTQYGPVAGVWFDPIMGYYFRPDLFPIAETYALIRRLQPQALIGFKQGATGDEDFASPEHFAQNLAERVAQMGGSETAVATARRAWESNRHKPNETCTTMHPAWGCKDCADSEHKTPDQVLADLAHAAANGWNLLLNTGPLPDGTIHPLDAATLREVGRRIARDGWPEPAAAASTREELPAA